MCYMISSIEARQNSLFPCSLPFAFPGHRFGWHATFNLKQVNSPMSPVPPDLNDDESLFLKNIKPLSGRDDYVSTRTTKPVVMNVPKRARDSDHVGRDRAVDDVGGREMDGKMAARVRAGKITIDARLDLHGDTVDQARARVQAFVLGAVDRGYRCILVITGKGTFGAAGPASEAENAPLDRSGPRFPSAKRRTAPKGLDNDTHVPRPGGRIRAAFPGWMSEPPLDRLVLMTAPAQQKDGGMGAFYVYLRQAKKA